MTDEPFSRLVALYHQHWPRDLLSTPGAIRENGNSTDEELRDRGTWGVESSFCTSWSGTTNGEGAEGDAGPGQRKQAKQDRANAAEEDQPPVLRYQA